MPPRAGIDRRRQLRHRHGYNLVEPLGKLRRSWLIRFLHTWRETQRLRDVGRLWRRRFHAVGPCSLSTRLVIPQPYAKARNLIRLFNHEASKAGRWSRRRQRLGFGVGKLPVCGSRVCGGNPSLSISKPVHRPAICREANADMGEMSSRTSRYLQLRH